MEWIQTEGTREKAEEVKKKLEQSGEYYRLQIRKNSPKQASRGHGTFYRIWGEKFADGGRTLDVPNLNDGDFVPTYKQGGKPDWIQKVVDSPKFDKGAFTRKAKNRGMTTTELMNDVLSNPNEYTLKTRRQAQFMKNVSR